MTLAWLLLAAQDPVVLDGDGSFGHLAIDEDGGVYVAFLRQGKVYVSSSTDRGRTFCSPVAAIEAAARIEPNSGHGGCRIAVDSAKSIYAACYVPREASSDHGLFLAVSTDRGRSFGRVRKVAGASDFSRLAASPKGGVHAAWNEGARLLYARITDRISPVRTVAPSVCARCSPGLAVDLEDNPMVAWRNFSNSDEVLVSFSSDGGSSFGKNVRAGRPGRPWT